MKKRMFSFILSLCMCMSCVPMQARAHESALQVSSGDVQQISDIVVEEQVSMGDIGKELSSEEIMQIQNEVALMVMSLDEGANKITENQLYLYAPSYLYNKPYDDIIDMCGDMALEAMGSVSETDEVLASFMHGLKEGASFIWNEIWASCGLTDSTYSEFQTEAAKEVVLEYLNANQNLVKVSREVGESFGVVDELYDITTEGGKEGIAKLIKKNNTLLSEAEVDKMTESLFANIDTLMKYAGEVEELFMLSMSLVEMQMIEIQAIDDLIVIHNQIKDKTMRDALVQLRNEITTDIGTYFITTYFKDKALEVIQDEVKKAVLNLTVGESYFSDFSVALGKFVVSSVASIYEAVKPSVADIVYSQLLVQYWNDSNMAVGYYKDKFRSGNGNEDDIRLYEAAINFNCACTKLFLSKTKELVKNSNQALYIKMDCWESSMGSQINYDLYLQGCLLSASKAIEEGALVLEEESATIKDVNGNIIDESYDSTESIKARFEVIQKEFIPNVGQTWNDEWYGTTQCFGFARMVFYKLFDCNMPAQYLRSAKYRFATEVNVDIVGQLVGNEVSASSAKELLQKGKLGDIVQASGNTYGQHTMVFVSADDSGVTVYDCNAHLDKMEPNCVIHQWKISWNDWASWYGNGSVDNENGISLYRASNYAKIYDNGEDIFFDDTANFVIEEGVLTKYNGSKYIVEIPDTVTAIGDGAFKNNMSIHSVNIPDSVTSIGMEAFEGCTSLVDVAIPDHVTDIGQFAFYGCKNVTNITLPKSLQTIGRGAFAYCGITSVEIPKNLQVCSGDDYTIGPFNGASLSKVTFEEGTTKIVNDLFAGCAGLNRVEIPDGVTTIESRAFDSSNLKEVIIPDSVISIGEDAFYYCSNLTNVTLPKSLETIGDAAFAYCGLTSVEIPKSLQSCSDGGAFGYCDNLSEITFEEGTTKIVKNLLEACSGLTRIEIPNTVSVIEENAFGNCINLKEIIIPYGVKEIQRGAFHSCDSLKEIVIPDSVTSMGSNTFYMCTNLSDVTLSKSLQTIGGGAFAYCSNLMSIEIPKSLQQCNLNDELGGAFYNCDNLSQITFEEGTTKIANNLFTFCTSLTNVDIPNTVTVIGEGAFTACINLEKIIIPDSVISIQERAFDECNALLEVEIPNSVVEVGDYAFRWCEKLESVNLGTGITEISCGMFKNCSSLERLELPNNIIMVDKEAFSNCTNLSEIIIPKGTTSISMETFTNPSELVIYGYYGTYAEDYAEIIGAKFVNLDVQEISVTISEKTKILYKGTGVQLKAYVEPEKFKKLITWNSSDKEIATITKDGYVESINPGEVMITATVGDVSDTCTIIVLEKECYHSGGIANCTQRAVCEKCHLEYGSINSNVHDYIQTVIQEPTTEDEGQKKYTCSRCSHTYFEKIDKLYEQSEREDNSESGQEEDVIQVGEIIPKSNELYIEKNNSNSNNVQNEERTNKKQTNEKQTNEKQDNSLNEGLPFVNSHIGDVQETIYGWEAIRKEIVDAQSGDEIIVDMNETTTVPKLVLQDIQGKNISILFVMSDNVIWKVDGKTIKNIVVENVDFGVLTNVNKIPQNIIETIIGENESLHISLAHNGEFGFKAILLFKLQKEHAGKYANLFYYNESQNTMEFVEASKIERDGNVEFVFEHASDYCIVIATEKLDIKKQEAEVIDEQKQIANENRQTSTDKGMIFKLIILSLVILSLGIVVYAIINKRKQND
ncbi:MAG: leucine-rich repeat protein [Lachnospiraceae bacterium]|nr:leucine-rich repeat protein [Lachnospiraceae bacterium]